jgi:hypothetical protein
MRQLCPKKKKKKSVNDDIVPRASIIVESTSRPVAVSTEPGDPGFA